MIISLPKYPKQLKPFCTKHTINHTVIFLKKVALTGQNTKQFNNVFQDMTDIVAL